MHTLPWKMGLCCGEQQIHLGGRGRIVGWARESGSRGEEWWWDTDPTPAGEHGEGRTVGKAERARVPPLSYRPHQDSHPTSLGALVLHTTHASLWAPREDPAHGSTLRCGSQHLPHHWREHFFTRVAVQDWFCVDVLLGPSPHPPLCPLPRLGPSHLRPLRVPSWRTCLSVIVPLVLMLASLVFGLLAGGDGDKQRRKDHVYSVSPGQHLHVSY